MVISLSAPGLTALIMAIGDLNLNSGKVENTHQVTNHRAVAVMMFNF